ncbi:MAG TPA: hypothetical protein P5063_02770, partial [Methanomassiliicoccales archaeon]|nr:hypothetical protein [Methanomassiliicoccales archaeon]
MSEAQKAYDELDAMLSAMADGAKRQSMTETRNDLQKVRREIGNYFALLTTEVGKSSRSLFIEEAKERVLAGIENDDEYPDEEPDELVRDIIASARGALGWVVAVPVDPMKVAEVVARDRAAAEKAGHPVGP